MATLLTASEHSRQGACLGWVGQGMQASLLNEDAEKEAS